ncbi:MAG TPA: MFS transporter [Fimbriimonadaceae bacterium]|jgi:MFS family permease
MRKPSPILGIALTVFIDILSFGLVIPDIQLRGELLIHQTFGLTIDARLQGLILGLTIATYSIAQLITSPILGRLSDKVGRRSILLCTTLLSATAYLFYSHAILLWVMIAARVLGGIGGANIGVAYAYVADVTSPQNRGKAMGLIGAAFGLGFIFGPGIGSVLVKLGHNTPTVLGYTSTALCILNFAYVYYLLPESHQNRWDASAESASAPATNRAKIRLADAFKTPGLGLLLAMFFCTNFGFSNMESTFFRLAEHNFGMSQLQTAMILTEVGIVMAIVQGGLIRVVIPMFGEVNLLRTAYFLQVPALLCMPWASPWIPMMLVAAVLGLGGGLSQPSMSSLISLNTPGDMQGGIFGITQGLGALARILGPTIGNTLFDVNSTGTAPYNNVRHWYPYTFGAAVVLLPLLASFKLKMPDKSHDTAHAIAG